MIATVGIYKDKAYINIRSENKEEERLIEAIRQNNSYNSRWGVY